VSSVLFLSCLFFLTHLCFSFGRYMFDAKRKTTSIVYLSSLATSIIVCFIPMTAGAKIAVLVLRECHSICVKSTH
jgi:hypothetical protein